MVLLSISLYKLPKRQIAGGLPRRANGTAVILAEEFLRIASRKPCLWHRLEAISFHRLVPHVTAPMLWLHRNKSFGLKPSFF